MHLSLQDMYRTPGLYWLMLTVCFVSCERVIEFTPEDTGSKMVVEATIENGKHPVVYLTRSMDFFGALSPEVLAGAFVRHAVVTISNGSRSVTLKEYETRLDDGYSIYHYSVDSTGPGMSFKGELGASYTLTIEVGGEAYTATTTIPKLAKKIDSMYYEEKVDKDDSTKVLLYGRFNDPPGLGNYTRYFTKVNRGRFLPGLNSVADDRVIDGKAYSVQIDQGVDRNTEIDYEEYAFFRRGDTITIKFCNIDRGVFDFWRTMEYSYANIGNPFSSPTKVIGNISDGGLGYFGGYAVQYSTIIIPE